MGGCRKVIEGVCLGFGNGVCIASVGVGLNVLGFDVGVCIDSVAWAFNDLGFGLRVCIVSDGTWVYPSCNWLA